MSDFIVSMPAGGLSDRPPESNVMPLPTNARWPFGAARRVLDLDQPRRAGRALADADDAAVAALGQRLLVETVTLTGAPLAAATASSAKAAGGRSPGAVLTRSRVRWIAVARCSARVAAALAPLSLARSVTTVTERDRRP